MESVRTTASNLPISGIQANHFFAKIALKAYVEAAPLDVNNPSSVFPARFDQRRPDAIQPKDVRSSLQLSCSYVLVEVFQTRAHGLCVKISSSCRVRCIATIPKISMHSEIKSSHVNRFALRFGGNMKHL